MFQNRFLNIFLFAGINGKVTLALTSGMLTLDYRNWMVYTAALSFVNLLQRIPTVTYTITI